MGAGAPGYAAEHPPLEQGNGTRPTNGFNDRGMDAVRGSSKAMALFRPNMTTLRLRPWSKPRRSSNSSRFFVRACQVRALSTKPCGRWNSFDTVASEVELCWCGYIARQAFVMVSHTYGMTLWTEIEVYIFPMTQRPFRCRSGVRSIRPSEPGPW